MVDGGRIATGSQREGQALLLTPGEISAYPLAVVADLGEIVENHLQILLDRGWDAKKVLDEALVGGMNIVGIDFRDGILFVPEVLLAANEAPARIRHVSAASSDNDTSEKRGAPATTLSLGPKTIRVAPGTTAIVEVAIDHLNRIVTGPGFTPDIFGNQICNDIMKPRKLGSITLDIVKGIDRLPGLNSDSGFL